MAVQVTVILNGSIAKEPEHAFSPKGKNVEYCKIAMVEQVYNFQTKSSDDKWWNLTMFRELAAWGGENLKQNDYVEAKGKLNTRLYNGRIIHEVIVDEIRILSEETEEIDVDELLESVNPSA